MKTRVGWRIGSSAVFVVLAAASSKGVPAAEAGTLDRIAFTSNRSGTAQIYVMNADGSGQSRITTTTPPSREFGNGYPAFAPRVESAGDPNAQTVAVARPDRILPALAVARRGGILPATGSTHLPLAALAILLVAAGSALLRIGKSRSHKIP